MPIEPVYHSTGEIMQRLKSIGNARPPLRHSELDELASDVQLDVIHVKDQILEAVKHTVDALPKQPKLSEVKSAVGSLARNVDGAGKLHAALTHALEISRPATILKPLSALPRTDYATELDQPLQTRREIEVLQRTHDAVERAINEFDTGIRSKPYMLDNNPRENKKFILDLGNRRDIYDILDKAREQLTNVRKNTADREAVVQWDDSNLAITPAQNDILQIVARGFVSDLVQGTQQALHSAGKSENRDADLHQHVKSAMRELDANKEPLRFATSWTTDEHYHRAHSFISKLPSFQHVDVTHLDNYRERVDHALISVLHERAYPAEAINAEIDQAINADPSHRFLKVPLVRAALAAASVALHLNPQFYPLKAVRPVIATRKYIVLNLALQSRFPNLYHGILAFARKRNVAKSVPPPQIPERALYNSLLGIESKDDRR